MPYIFETFKQLHDTFCCKRKLLNDSINGKLTLQVKGLLLTMKSIAVMVISTERFW